MFPDWASFSALYFLLRTALAKPLADMPSGCELTYKLSYLTGQKYCLQLTNQHLTSLLVRSLSLAVLSLTDAAHSE